MTTARAKGNVKPLGEKPTEAEIKDYREKMGIPHEPYTFDKPETLPEGVEWPEERVKELGAWFQQENFTPAQAKRALDKHMELLSADYNTALAAHNEQRAKDLAAEQQQLALTFGGELDSTIVAAQRAALWANIPTQALDPSSPSFVGVTMLGVFAKMSELLGESRLPTTAAVTNMSPLLQAQDIQTNPANPEHAAFLKGDSRVMAKIIELTRVGSQGRR